MPNSRTPKFTLRPAGVAGLKRPKSFKKVLFEEAKSAAPPQNCGLAAATFCKISALACRVATLSPGW